MPLHFSTCQQTTPLHQMPWLSSLPLLSFRLVSRVEVSHHSLMLTPPLLEVDAWPISWPQHYPIWPQLPKMPLQLWLSPTRIGVTVSVFWAVPIAVSASASASPVQPPPNSPPMPNYSPHHAAVIPTHHHHPQ